MPTCARAEYCTWLQERLRKRTEKRLALQRLDHDGHVIAEVEVKEGWGEQSPNESEDERRCVARTTLHMRAYLLIRLEQAYETVAQLVLLTQDLSAVSVEELMKRIAAHVEGHPILAPLSRDYGHADLSAEVQRISRMYDEEGQKLVRSLHSLQCLC
jgi:hypothetical protein